MAIRIRKVKNVNATGGFSYIALCAVETKLEKGDLYLDDSIDYALRVKFLKDYRGEGLIQKLEVTEEWIERLIWTIEIDATRKKKIERIRSFVAELKD